MGVRRLLRSLGLTLSLVQAIGEFQLWNSFSSLFSKGHLGSSHCGSVVMNPTSIHEDVGSIPGLAQWVKDPMLL